MQPVLNLKPLNILIYHRHGRNAHSKRPAAERRLDDKNQHQGCILCDFNPSAASENAFILHASHFDWCLPQEFS